MILLLGQWALHLVENQLAMLLEYAQRRFERMPAFGLGSCDRRHGLLFGYAASREAAMAAHAKSWRREWPRPAIGEARWCEIPESAD